MKKQENVIKGFKGFDKDLKCRGFQYTEGEEYETDQKPVRCTSTGFHFCEDALDVFSYYPPLTSKFHEAIGSGDVDRVKNEDSKIAVSKIKIGAEISLFQMIKLGVECILKRVKATTGDSAHSATTGNSAHSATTGNSAHSATTGDYAHSATTGNYAHSATTGNSAHSATTGNSAHSATTGNSAHSATTGDYAHSATTGNSAHSATTGDYAHSATTGDSAHSATTGDYAHSATTGNYAHSATTGYSAHSATTGHSAHSATTGKESIACGLGIDNVAKASIGSWIVLAEYKENSREVKCVKSAKIDGKKLLPDTFYALKNGKFVKSNEQ